MKENVLLSVLKIYYPALLLGTEFLLICIVMLIWVHWGEKLDNYLQKNYYQFWKKNLDAPLLAGGPDVMKKHYKVLKVAYGGEMPDEVSKAYQRKIKFYAKLTVFAMIILIITMILISLIQHT